MEVCRQIWTAGYSLEERAYSLQNINFGMRRGVGIHESPLIIRNNHNEACRVSKSCSIVQSRPRDAGDAVYHYPNPNPENILDTRGETIPPPIEPSVQQRSDTHSLNVLQYRSMPGSVSIELLRKA